MSIAEKMQTVAQNQQRVYDAGCSQGEQAGYTSGLATGTEQERRLLWGAILREGKRQDYTNAFWGTAYTKDSFCPCYDIVPYIATGMFYQCATDNSKLFSMTEVEETLGIKFDFSHCTNFYQSFYGSPFREINTIDLSAATAANSAYNMFAGGIRKINHLIFSEQTCACNSLFYFGNLSKLTYVGFEGIMARTLNAKIANLNKESIIAAMGILSDASSGQIVTFSLKSVNNAFETSTGAADGKNSDEWKALVATKPNWTVTLS